MSPFPVSCSAKIALFNPACMTFVPHLRRSNISSFLIPASRPGLFTAASSRLVWVLSVCLRPGKEQRREAPAVNSHARERAVKMSDRIEARKAGTQLHRMNLIHAQFWGTGSQLRLSRKNGGW